jgi:hypothetical protein
MTAPGSGGRRRNLPLQVVMAALAAVLLLLLYRLLLPRLVLLGLNLVENAVRCALFAGLFWMLTDLLPEPFRTGFRKMGKGTVRLALRFLGSFFRT